MTHLYTNGVEACSTSDTPPNPATGALGIGVAAPTFNTEFFSGSIDEVRIFAFASGQFSPSDLLIQPSYTFVSQPSTPVLFTTFGPNYAYSYLVESRFVAHSFYLAMPFRPISTAALGKILVPVYNVIPPSQIRFTLTTDNAGVPGTALETWSVTSPVYGALTALNSVNFPKLTKGVRYWLVGSADDPATESYWWIGPLDGSIPQDNLSSANQGATWSGAPVTDCAYEVDALNPVITKITAANTNLVIVATNGVAGHAYITLTSTNATAALNAWTPIFTNHLSVDGSFTNLLTNAVPSSTRQKYFTLKMQ